MDKFNSLVELVAKGYLDSAKTYILTHNIDTYTLDVKQTGKINKIIVDSNYNKTIIERFTIIFGTN